MNLNKIRDIIKTYMGKEHKFIYKGTRNQIEEFTGTITNCFPSIFIIETTSGIKSFSYNDFIIKSIKIINE